MSDCHCSILFLIAIVLSQSAQSTCSTFGSDSTVQGQRPINSNPQGLYVDLDHPAQCSGFLTAWTYCFHRPRSGGGGDRNYTAKFAVYRRRRSSAGEYAIVPNSVYTVTLSRLDSVASGPFNCTTLSVPSDKEFPIEINDVLGVCLPQRRGLGIVSNGNGTRVYSDRGRDCDDNDIGEVTGNNIQSTGLTLHLYATLSKYYSLMYIIM